MRVASKSNLIILLKLIISIALAFSLCGLTSSLIGLLRDPVILFKDPLGTLITVAFASLWFGIGATVIGGFPLANEAGVEHINMYPEIALTAFILFFLLSKGWRWFRYNNAALL